jgi:nucleotide-binding universal stress UspA family protein
MPGIVLTTDLSTESQRAFAPVAALARKLGLKVTLLSVIEDLPFEPTAGGLMAVYPDPVQVRRDWQQSLDRLADELGRDICAEAITVEAADVSRAIVEHASKQQADFIAMATHGRSGLRRLLLGSVAEHIVRHAHVPILLYPPPAP